MKAGRVGKAKWKPLVLPLPENSEPKPKSHPGGTAKISVTIKDSKDAGVVAPTSSFSSPSGPSQKTDGREWQVTVESLIRQ